MLIDTVARSARPSQRTLLITAVVSAVLLFALTAASPTRTLGTTTSTKVALCNANLRTSASTTARIRKMIKTGTKVTVVATVTGRSYRTSCSGTIVSGRSWSRISAVNGRSVKSLYGVTYLYAAKGLFKTVPVTKYAACSLSLRTGVQVGAAAKATVKTDTMLTVVANVSGRSYSTTCAGKAASGSTWARVSAVDGRSVKSLYGVTYLYAPTKLLASARTLVPPPTPAVKGTLEGLDVSHWQNAIDWTAVAGAGKKFTYIKASEDLDFIDPLYAVNRAGAGAAGLVVGAYHFAQPDMTPGDGAAEADHFLDTAMPVGGDLIPVLDLERTGGLSSTNLTAWVRAYLQRIDERLGVHAVIYCSPNFWKNYMGDTTWFANNGYEVLWVAHWTTASGPSVPGGAWGANGWTFWQYTSSGVVPGIGGRVDLNRYNGTDLAGVRIP